MKLYFTGLMLLLFSVSQAQSELEVKQFIKETAAEKNDTVKIRKLNRLVTYYQNFDVKKARVFANEMESLSRKINFKKGMAHYYYAEAGNKLFEGNFEGCVKDADIASAMSLQIQDQKSYMASVYRASLALSNLGLTHEIKKKISHALNIVDKDKFPLQRALLYSELGNTHKKEKNYDQSVTAIKMAHELFKKAQFNPGIAKCLSTLGMLYNKIGDTKTAFSYSKQALAIESDRSDFNEQSLLLYNMGAILAAMNKYDEALKYFILADNDAKKSGVKGSILQVNIDMAQAYFELRNFKKALSLSIENEKLIAKDNPMRYNIAYTKGASYLALENNKQALISLMEARELILLYHVPADKSACEVQLFKALSTAYKQNGNYKEALRYNDLRLNAAIDRLEERKDKEINDVLGKYRLGEKNKAIRNLSLQKQNETLKANQRQDQLIITLGIIVIICIILIVLYLRFKSNKRTTSLLQSKNTEIAAANEKLEVSLSEKELLLREIHHRVKNNLQLVISLLSIQSSKFKNQELKDFLESGTGRIISMALIHENLYQTENVASIRFEEYAESLIQTIIASMADEQHVKYSITAADIHLDIEQAIPLGLILNELVVNTIKHNYTLEKDLAIYVGLKQAGSQHEFTYMDPQSTMTPAHTKKSSFGLELIHLLAAQLDGESTLLFTNGLTAKIVF